MKDRNLKAGNVMARVIVARGGWMKRVKEGECGWGMFYTQMSMNIENCW
jgi:hypothetical protein